MNELLNLISSSPKIFITTLVIICSTVVAIGTKDVNIFFWSGLGLFLWWN